MEERLVVMSTTLQEPQLEYLRKRYPQFTFKSYGRLEMPPVEELERAEIAFVYGGGNLVPYLKNCRFIHNMGAGVDGLIPIIDRYLGPDFPFSNGRGMYNVTLGEHTLGLLLTCLRGLDRCARNMSEGNWETYPVKGEIYDATVLILGAGAIGTHTAEAVKGFRPKKIIGYKRTPCAPFGPYDEIITTAEELDQALSVSDFVLISLPGGKFTKGLLDARRLNEVMKPGAGLVNIGRGSIVDTEAMMEALRTGRLSFAAMDVTDPEPLPKDHPLWKMDNVLISAHYAGLFANLQKHAEWFAENLDAFLAGKPLPGAVHHDWLY